MLLPDGIYLGGYDGWRTKKPAVAVSRGERPNEGRLTLGTPPP
jgi:hypothetical protein